MNLFESKAYHLHHQRAKQTFHAHNFLYAHVEKELTARLQDFRKTFQTSLGLSAYPLNVTQENASLFEESFTLSEGSFDLIISCLQAHWVNNLPGLLKGIHSALKDEGLFLGALFGGNTLIELRESLLQAELELKGGAAARIAPMLHPADAPGLLSQASFFMPVVDRETITVTYPSLTHLMKDLRGMGETNKLAERPKGMTSRRLFEMAENLYFKKHNVRGLLPATFEIIYLTGWRKD
ncbi:MAG: methyltransferase domain-containing protein [Alphaproteobacteria bacterium]|nr:methyltransferase domain-containing protein [Alphaproteobacteria bacterium]